MLDSLIGTSTISLIKDSMVSVSTAIGQGAEYAWQVIILQMYVQAAQYLIFALFAFILTLWSYARLKETWKDFKAAHRGSRDGLGVMGAVLGIICAFSLFIGMLFLTGSAGRLINPDFYAIQFLVNAVKPSSDSSNQ